MKKFSVAAGGACCARPSWLPVARAMTHRRPTQASSTGKLEGSISVWIMDPGSPKIQDVVKQYGTDFEAAHPGTKVEIQFVPWAQAHDKFVTAIAGGKVPGRGRDGHDVDAGVRRPGRAHRAAEDRQGRLRLLPGRRRDARRQGLRQAVVRGRSLAHLPQGHPREGGREAAEELGRDDGRREGDQGEGPGRLPGLLHRPERAHVPADDLAGRRARSPPRTATRGRRR